MLIRYYWLIVLLSSAITVDLCLVVLSIFERMLKSPVIIVDLFLFCFCFLFFSFYLIYFVVLLSGAYTARISMSKKLQKS